MIILVLLLVLVKIWNPTGENAMLLLDKAVRKHGVPEQILTDPWYTV
jgi:hypothetical protein